MSRPWGGEGGVRETGPFPSVGVKVNPASSPVPCSDLFSNSCVSVDRQTDRHSLSLSLSLSLTPSLPDWASAGIMEGAVGMAGGLHLFSTCCPSQLLDAPPSLSSTTALKDSTAGHWPHASAAWSARPRPEERTQWGSYPLTEAPFPPCQGVTWSRAWFPLRSLAAAPCDWVAGLPCGTPLAATPVVPVPRPHLEGAVRN